MCHERSAWSNLALDVAPSCTMCCEYVTSLPLPRVLPLTHEVVFFQVFAQFPAARAAVREVCLVETSEAMRVAQEAKLGDFARKNGWSVNWYDAIDQIAPESTLYTLVLAHEFFDALPFHLLQVSGSANCFLTVLNSYRVRKPSRDGRKCSLPPDATPPHRAS